MDKIDKFLGRRKQKNKKSVKINNNYYDITKQDIKIIRQYKKNKCLDETVDMYIPYKKSNMQIEFKDNIKKKINEEKQIKKYIKKHDFIKPEPVDQNVITDIWEDDDLDSYEQNIVLDINKQYEKNVSDLWMDREILEKELRRVYLKQYLPRTKNNLKISDLIKKHSSTDSYLYPSLMSKWYNLNGNVQYFYFVNGNILEECLKKEHENIEDSNDKNKNILISSECEGTVFNETDLKNIFVNVLDNTIEFYEVNNFYKFYTIKTEFKIVKVEINKSINILCEKEKNYRLLFTYINNELILLDEGHISDFSDNFIIKNKKVKVANKKIIQQQNTNKNIINFKNYKNKNKDNLKKIKCYKDKLFLTGINIFRILNIDGRLLNEYKVFGDVIDFVVSGDIIFLINSLKNIIIYNYILNVVVHSMKQDNNLNSLCYNSNHKLLAVGTDINVLIYYIDIEKKYVLVNKIKGKHSNIKFCDRMYWLYGKKKEKFLLYT